MNSTNLKKEGFSGFVSVKELMEKQKSRTRPYGCVCNHQKQFFKTKIPS